jgi:hypothetical protein
MNKKLALMVALVLVTPELASFNVQAQTSPTNATTNSQLTNSNPSDPRSARGLRDANTTREELTTVLLEDVPDAGRFTKRRPPSEDGQ